MLPRSMPAWLGKPEGPRATTLCRLSWYLYSGGLACCARRYGTTPPTDAHIAQRGGRETSSRTCGKVWVVGCTSWLEYYGKFSCGDPWIEYQRWKILCFSPPVSNSTRAYRINTSGGGSHFTFRNYIIAYHTAQQSAPALLRYLCSFRSSSD